MLSSTCIGRFTSSIGKLNMGIVRLRQLLSTSTVFLITDTIRRRTPAPCRGLCRSAGLRIRVFGRCCSIVEAGCFQQATPAGYAKLAGTRVGKRTRNRRPEHKARSPNSAQFRKLWRCRSHKFDRSLCKIPFREPTGQLGTSVFLLEAASSLMDD